MRLRVPSLGFIFILLVAAVVVAVAQPPVPPVGQPPASASPGTPIEQSPQAAITVPTAGPSAGATPQAGGTDTPLGRFEPLAAFPPQTQAVVRGVLLSANWMTRMNQPHGRFRFGFNPALYQPLPKDHDLLQARAALAMAQAAAFTGNEKQAAIATQAILALLTTTRVDPADPACRVPLHSSFLCNRVGFAATMAMAIYALPGADAKRLDEAERLCEFIHRQCRPDGSIRYTDGTTDNSSEIDPAGFNEYPGLALQAVMAGYRSAPAAWKLETLTKALPYYRARFQAHPHPILAATLAPAFAELYLQTKQADAASVVLELNDALCGYQVHGGDTRLPQWIGGFRTVVNGQSTDALSGPETGWYVASLCSARRVARQGTGDLDRHSKFLAASQEAAQYLLELQYVESNTRHFETSFRVNMLMGAFHLTPTDGTVRIDAAATAVSGLLQFLYTVLERS